MAHDSKRITQFYLLSTHEPYLPLLPAAEHHCCLACTHYAYPRKPSTTLLCVICWFFSVLNEPELVSAKVGLFAVFQLVQFDWL